MTSPNSPDPGRPPRWTVLVRRTWEVLGRAVRETREVSTATWRQTARIAGIGRTAWAGRRLRQAVIGHERSLGEASYRAGAGDPLVRGRIAALDADLAAAVAKRLPTRAVHKLRDAAVRQLGCEVAGGEAPPGLDDEVQKVSDAREAARLLDDELRRRRLVLPPRDRSEWLRVVFGYGVLAVVIGSPLLLRTGGRPTPTGDSSRLSSADASPPTRPVVDPPSAAAAVSSSTRSREVIARVEELRDQDRDEDALAYSRRAVGELPASDELQVLLGHVLADSDRFDEALDIADAVLRTRPQDVRARLLRVRAYIGKGDLPLALDECHQAMRLDRTDPECYYRRGIIHIRKADYRQTVADMTEAIRLGLSGSLKRSALAGRGAAAMELRDNDAALADLTAAAAGEGRKRMLGYVLAMRGGTLMNMADYRAAVNDLERSIQLDPKYPYPHATLAMLRAAGPDDLRDGAAAVAGATRACELTGWKDSYSLLRLAAAHAEAGDFRTATARAEEAAARASLPAERSNCRAFAQQFGLLNQPYRLPPEKTPTGVANATPPVPTRKMPVVDRLPATLSITDIKTVLGDREKLESGKRDDQPYVLESGRLLVIEGTNALDVFIAPHRDGMLSGKVFLGSRLFEMTERDRLLALLDGGADAERLIGRYRVHLTTTGDRDSELPRFWVRMNFEPAEPGSKAVQHARRFVGAYTNTELLSASKYARANQTVRTLLSPAVADKDIYPRIRTLNNLADAAGLTAAETLAHVERGVDAARRNGLEPVFGVSAASDALATRVALSKEDLERWRKAGVTPSPAR